MTTLSDQQPAATPARRLRSNPRGLDAVGLAARLLLGGVMLVAGALKVAKPEVSARAVQAYQLLPFDLATYIGYGLPILEVVLGALLIAGPLHAGRGCGLRRAARGVHRRHRLGLGARAEHRLRLLRRRRDY